MSLFISIPQLKKPEVHPVLGEMISCNLFVSIPQLKKTEVYPMLGE